MYRYTLLGSGTYRVEGQDMEVRELTRTQLLRLIDALSLVGGQCRPTNGTRPVEPTNLGRDPFTALCAAQDRLMDANLLGAIREYGRRDDSDMVAVGIAVAAVATALEDIACSLRRWNG